MIEYKIAAVIWLIACAAWFGVGYALGKKRGHKKGVEMVTAVFNKAKAADEGDEDKGTFPNAADGGCRECGRGSPQSAEQFLRVHERVAVVAEQADNPIFRMRCGNNNREESYDSREC